MADAAITVPRVEAALRRVAAMVAQDPAFIPIFERLEDELALAQEREADICAAQARARALLESASIGATAHHSAQGDSTSLSCASEAPAP